METDNNSPQPWVDTYPKSDLTKSTIQNLIDLLRKLKFQESVIESVKKDLHFTEQDPIMKELLTLQTHLNDKVAVKTISKSQNY